MNGTRVYETVIGANGLATCTCRAGQVGRHPCKHVETARELVKALTARPGEPVGQVSSA